jgi:Putative porin
MRKGKVWFGAVVAATMVASAVHAKDLGDILVQKGLITEEELKQAREEDKQKAAAEESLRDAILAKIPKWLDKISLFGDLRNRVEGFYGNNFHARTRYRIRGRVGLNANITDEISGTVRLATGDANDPISTNQTLSNTFTRKPFNLDWLYMTIKPGATFGLEPGWGQIVLGKFGLPVVRTSELVWDDDLAPEGATETLNLVTSREGFFRSARLSALQWEVNETSNNNDSYILGGQAAIDTAIDSTATWSASFGDYSFQGMNRVARTYLSPSSGSFNSALANSNDVVTNANNQIIAYGRCNSAGQCTGLGFNIINFNSELNFSNPFGLGIPVGAFGDVAYNSEADGRNTGVVIGLGIGKAGKDWYHMGLKNPGDWGASYCWEWVEKDAVVSLFSYSDFVYQQPNTSQSGSTNVTGSIIRFDYVLFPNFQLTAKSHFINALDPSIATTSNGKPLVGNSSLTRLQLDAVLKF